MAQFELVTSDPDRPRDVSPWTAETAEPFLRTLVSCFAGTYDCHDEERTRLTMLLGRDDHISWWCHSRLCHCLENP